MNVNAISKNANTLQQFKQKDNFLKLRKTLNISGNGEKLAASIIRKVHCTNFTLKQDDTMYKYKVKPLIILQKCSRNIVIF